MSLQTAQELCEEDKVLLVLSGCLVLLFREEHVLIGQRLLNCVFIFGDVAGKVVQLLVLEEFLHDQFVLKVTIGQVSLNQLDRLFTVLFSKFSNPRLQRPFQPDQRLILDSRSLFIVLIILFWPTII